MAWREKSHETRALRRAWRGPGPEVQTKASMLLCPQQCVRLRKGLYRPWCADSKAENLRDPSLSSPVCLRVSSCLCELDPFFSFVCASSKPPHLSQRHYGHCCPKVASVPGLESHPQPSLFPLPLQTWPSSEGKGDGGKWKAVPGDHKAQHTLCVEPQPTREAMTNTTNQATTV